jgi:hypothetical protein
MPTETLHIENAEEEIEIEVEFDYEPDEAMTRDYPGATASASIYEVTNLENGSEICLLPKVQEQIEEDLVEKGRENEEERRQYKRYGYMLEDY